MQQPKRLHDVTSRRGGRPIKRLAKSGLRLRWTQDDGAVLFKDGRRDRLGRRLANRLRCRDGGCRCCRGHSHEFICSCVSIVPVGEGLDAVRALALGKGLVEQTMQRRRAARKKRPTGLLQCRGALLSLLGELGLIDASELRGAILVVVQDAHNACRLRMHRDTCTGAIGHTSKRVVRCLHQLTDSKASSHCSDCRGDNDSATRECATRWYGYRRHGAHDRLGEVDGPPQPHGLFLGLRRRSSLGGPLGAARPLLVCPCEKPIHIVTAP